MVSPMSACQRGLNKETMTSASTSALMAALCQLEERPISCYKWICKHSVSPGKCAQDASGDLHHKDYLTSHHGMILIPLTRSQFPQEQNKEVGALVSNVLLPSTTL